MYETFFGLKRRPFLAVPDTESYYSLPQWELSRQSVSRAAQRGEGISLIIGPSGIGKTLLLRLLRKTLETEYTVILLSNGHLNTPKAFFQQVLYELRLPFTDADENELRLILMNFARQEDSAGVVLLIDEAQFLTSSVLEEIRLLMNCDDGAVPFFHAVLAGTIEVEETLTHPNLEALNQRIACRLYLDKLNCSETSEYITWQTSLSRGGCVLQVGVSEGLAEFINHSASDRCPSESVAAQNVMTDPAENAGRRFDAPHLKVEPIFTLDAKWRIHRLTEGLPRLINQLCDSALQLAAEQVVRQIDAKLVLAAWAKLQQINPTQVPNEQTEEPKHPSHENIEAIIAKKKQTFRPREFSSTIEFGTLDEGTFDEETLDDRTSSTLQVASVLMLPDQSVRVEKTEPSELPKYLENIVRLSVGYKPPYPGDDECLENESGSVSTQNETEIVLVVESGQENEATASIEANDVVEDTFTEMIVGAEIEVLLFPTLFRTELLLLTMEPVPINSVIEDIVSIPTSCEDPLMDRETLEKYGAEILDGRPPFVRKEPQYVYDTSDLMPDVKGTVAYPDPVTGCVVELNWVEPNRSDDIGFGTAYCEFIARDDEVLPCSLPESCPEDVGTSMLESVAEFEAARIVRVALDASQNTFGNGNSFHSSLDEVFEESITLRKAAVPLDEAFRPNRAVSQSVPPCVTVIFDTDAAQRQLDVAVSRITAAAEKIEQAAVMTEDAGHHVKRSAVYVEKEVQAALPTYKELFQELSSFQQTISHEIREMRARSNDSFQVGASSSSADTRRAPSQGCQEQYHRGREHYMEQNQDQDKRSQLIPFPKRPDFIPQPESPVTDTENKRKSPELHNPDTTRHGSSKEEKSIDVRTLFQ